MKKEKQHSSRGLPFIEIVLVLGIFTVLSVLIARIFVATDQMRRKAEEMSRGVMEAQNIAEQIKGQKLDEELYTKLGAQKEEGEEFYTIYYDKDWKASSVKGEYVITISWEEELTSYGGMDTYKLMAYKDTKERRVLCDLVIKKIK